MTQQAVGTTVVVKTEQEQAMLTVKDLLQEMKAQIQMALPKHIKADYFIRVAVTCCQKNPKLLECAPITLIGALVQCAQLGLVPDDGTGKAYLVPFNNTKKNRLEVQFIAGYKGLIQLARNSGQVQQVEGRVVHAKDRFSYNYGLNPVLDHVPSMEADPGPPVYFYAIARFKDGGAQFDVMSKGDVDRIRARAPGKNSPAWVNDYDEMGKKTPTRRLCKYLPASAELLIAVNLDEKGEIGIPQDLGMLVDSTETPTPQEEAKAEDLVPMPERTSTQSSSSTAPAASDAPTSEENARLDRKAQEKDGKSGSAPKK